MLQIHRWFILVGIVFIIFIFLSVDFKSNKMDSGFNKWVKNYTKELEDKNIISKDTLENFKAQVKINENIINNETKDNSPKLTLNQEIKAGMSENLLLSSQVFFKENMDVLKELENKYKVPSSLVVSIFAINSKFGNDTGFEPLLNTITTLAYMNDKNPNSSIDYKTELTSLLTLIDNKYVNIDVLGKRNGTFSYLSILPSTYLKEGVDSTNKGYVDLINSKEDIFNTAYNMLSVTVWDKNNTWGDSVTIPRNSNLSSQQGISNKKLLEDWKSLGIVKSNGEMLPMNNGSAILIILDKPTEGILLYDNFNYIYMINNNLADAISIGLLSDQIKDYASLLQYGKANVKPKERIKYKSPKKSNKKISVADKYKDYIK